MKSKKRKFTSKDDEELRLCLTIVSDEDKEVGLMEIPWDTRNTHRNGTRRYCQYFDGGAFQSLIRDDICAIFLLVMTLAIPISVLGSHHVRVFNSPCFMVKCWLVQDQTVPELAIPEQTATGKGIPNPLMAGSLPKTIKPTELDVAVLLKRQVADEDG
ncbi:hypothetical protein Tco_0858859 [Tanacetum coccineum]|uniref:Uncharacterized protein n=1 Tax=Tanacetum coccineum TaxID=301880 RepID=A0ABQ5BDP7_9ASTR